MRKGDNRELAHDCVRIARKKGECLSHAGSSLFNRIRIHERRRRIKKNIDYQSTKARFQMSVEALGYTVIAIRQYACDGSYDCSDIDERDMFFGAVGKCFKYLFSKHRRAIEAIMSQLKNFSRN